jgi:hypothetical protein
MTNKSVASVAPSAAQVAAYDDLVRIGSLDRLDPVPAALEAYAVARRATVDAQRVYDELRETASDGGTKRERRDARAKLQTVLAAREDAAAGEDDARAALQRARADAYARAAPTINAEHQRRLPALEAALRAALDSARAVLAVEAGGFTLPSGGNIAPSRSPVAGRVGEHLVFEISRCLDIIARVRQTRPAA